MPFPRLIELPNGVLMASTDLHGHWNAYAALKDRFIAGRRDGTIDRWLLCGDLIHTSDGETANDHSLAMILDLMALQAEYGADRVMMLCGNHEFMHIFPIPISKGGIEFTPHFEACIADLDRHPQLGYRRADVIRFLESLPLYAVTGAGVMFAHAGVAPQINTPQAALRLLNLDFAAFNTDADEMLMRYDLPDARTRYAQKMQYGSYDALVKRYLAVTDPTDPRYDHLLRAFVYNSDPTFAVLWEALFNRNEQELPNDMRRAIAYPKWVDQFLQAVSAHVPHMPPQVLASGHIVVQGNHEVVDDFHLRFASYEHARPREAGAYLLLDCARPVEDAEALAKLLRPTF